MHGMKPGGWLVMSALEGATCYAVGDRTFPAVDISQEDLVDLLTSNGFSLDRVQIQSVVADRPTRDYRGLLLAVAQKDATGAGSPACCWTLPCACRC